MIWSLVLCNSGSQARGCVKIYSICFGRNPKEWYVFTDLRHCSTQMYANPSQLMAVLLYSTNIDTLVKYEQSRL